MAVTLVQNPNEDIVKAPHFYIGLSTDTKPTVASHAGLIEPTAGSEFWEYDTNKLYKTRDGTNWTFMRGAGAYLATKTSTSPLTSADLFTYTGSVMIIALIGRVETIIQSQATTVQLKITPDALSAYNITGNTKDINAFAVGSLLSITGTAADQVVGTTAVGAIAPGQANPIFATCVTSGTIGVTYGAASTGKVVWEINWLPLSANASVVAA